jgi:hypothetical protein
MQNFGLKQNQNKYYLLIKDEYDDKMIASIELKSTDFMFEIDCYIVVSKQFIIDNVNMNYSGNIVSPSEIRNYVRNGLIPTYAFNLASKKIQFKIEEFIKLSQMLFYSLYGSNATTNTYSVQFKIV